MVLSVSSSPVFLLKLRWADMFILFSLVAVAFLGAQDLDVRIIEPSGGSSGL